MGYKMSLDHFLFLSMKEQKNHERVEEKVALTKEQEYTVKLLRRTSSGFSVLTHLSLS